MTVTQLPFQGQDFPFKIGYKGRRTGFFAYFEGYPGALNSEIFTPSMRLKCCSSEGADYSLRRSARSN